MLFANSDELTTLYECDFDAAEASLQRLLGLQLEERGETPQAGLTRALKIVAASQAGRTQGAGDALDESITAERVVPSLRIAVSRSVRPASISS